MDFIDTHCHLDSILERLEAPDFADYRSRFLPAGFRGCVTISCHPASIGATLALMREEGVHGAFGIHPHDAKSYGDELESELVSAMADPKSVAWGEIGL